MLIRVVLAAVISLLPPAALAQEGGSVQDRFQTATAAAEAAYAAGDYALAVERYMDAYELIQTADLIYNVAFIYERHLGNPDLARVHYERVLRDPSAPADLVRKAGERIASLDRSAAARTTSVPRLSEEAPATQPAPVPEPTVSSTTTLRRKSNPGPWVMVGGGGALVVGGVIAGVVARGTNQDFLAGQGGVEGMRELSDRGQQQAVVADALWITGAVTAVAGLGWGIGASVKTRTGVVHIDLQPAPGSFSLAGRF